MSVNVVFVLFFICNDTSTTAIYTYGHTLSLHDALPIWRSACSGVAVRRLRRRLRSAVAEQVQQCLAPDPAELAWLHAGAVQDCDLEVLGRDHPEIGRAHV